MSDSQSHRRACSVRGSSASSAAHTERGELLTSERVSLVRCQTYESPALQRALHTLLEPLGGIGRFVRAGQRVLLKPNLIRPHNSLQGSCTHPALVAEVARMTLQAGAQVIVGDSPGYHSANTVARKSGLLDLLSHLGVPLVEFTDEVTMPRGPDDVFRVLRLTRDVVEADVLINLAKLKTHSQMLLTLAVKNMFGCVVGTRKAQWHLSAGRDRDLFARMLLEVYLAARPTLNILDGIVAMEGEGPTNGTPRQMNFLAASSDGVALDAVAAAIVGIQAEDLATLRAARARGVGQSDLSHIDLCGVALEEFAVKDFRLPSACRAAEFGPKFLHRWLRNVFTPRPVVNSSLCEGCGICAKVCPAECITNHEGGARIDTSSCIRCFCCQEMCPKGAVGVERGRLLKWAAARHSRR